MRKLRLVDYKPLGTGIQAQAVGLSSLLPLLYTQGKHACPSFCKDIFLEVELLSQSMHTFPKMLSRMIEPDHIFPDTFASKVYCSLFYIIQYCFSNML